MQITLDKNRTFQTIEGFGASGAWWAQVVGDWDHKDEKTRKSINRIIAELLYNKETGIGLSIYRYNLGGGSKNSGSSVFYNKNRMAESFDKGDGTYDWTRDSAAVNMMKLCVEEGADSVILFSNSPPERLTKNHKSCLDKAWRSNLPRKNEESFAEYLMDCAEHFLKEGFPVKLISPVNEPLWVWTEKNGQEGCHYTPYGVYSLLKKTAKALEKRPALKNVKLSACENGDIRWFNRTYTMSVLCSKKIRANTDGIDIHSYCIALPFPLTFLNNRVAFLRRFRKFMDVFFPQTKVNMSEWTHMKGGRDAGMDSALECAKIIHEDLTILRASTWQHWIAVSEVDYCDGLIYINEDDKTYCTTKRLFVTGNFSKYIPLGAKRIDISCDDKDIMASAYTDGKKNVTVLINPTKNKKSLLQEMAAKVCVAVTDKDRDLEEQIISQGKNIEIAPESVTTLVF